MTPLVELQNVEVVVVGCCVSASRMDSKAILDKNGHNGNGLKIQ